MISLPIGRFFELAQMLVSTNQLFQSVGQAQRHINLGDSAFQELAQCAVSFASLCDSMEMIVSGGAARRITTELQKATKQANGSWHFDADVTARCQNALNQLMGCLKHEADVKTAIILPVNFLPFFAPPSPLFGAAVSTKFPGVAFEIEEAGKCLALGRATACVFHLMRTLEVALEAVRVCLGLPKPSNPNWGAILTSIDSKITSLGKQWPERAFFQDVHAQLDIIRRAWRNSTMHVSNVYTADEARVLFDATKGFMDKVASRMDQSGLPLA